METIDPGHQYALFDYAGIGDSRVLTFYKKVLKEDGSYREESGTTNEIIIKVLLDRLKYLNALVPSLYNVDAIEHLQSALKCLNDRTADRVERDVEGSDKE